MRRNLLFPLPFVVLVALSLLSFSPCPPPTRTRITDMAVRCDAAQKRAVVLLTVDAVTAATAQVKLSAVHLPSAATAATKEKPRKSTETVSLNSGTNTLTLSVPLPLGNTSDSHGDSHSDRFLITATLTTPDGNKDSKEEEASL